MLQQQQKGVWCVLKTAAPMSLVNVLLTFEWELLVLLVVFDMYLRQLLTLIR